MNWYKLILIFDLLGAGCQERMDEGEQPKADTSHGKLQPSWLVEF